jgi:hypothetical protein
MLHWPAGQRGRTGVRRVLLVGVLAVVLPGCGLTQLENLNFRVDDRLEITSPEARALVKQPITVTWTMEDFTVQAPGSAPASRDAGYFAVFVDRTPIKPGQSLEAVASGDRACELDPECPDTAYLREQQVYTTTKTSLRIPQIPNGYGDDDVERHTITIVLLDTSGRRIGESAWQVDVRTRKIGV